VHKSNKASGSASRPEGRAYASERISNVKKTRVQKGPLSPLAPGNASTKLTTRLRQSVGLFVVSLIASFVESEKSKNDKDEKTVRCP